MLDIKIKWRLVLGLCVGLLTIGEVGQAQEATHFLIIKPGDASATPALASDFLNRMAAYLERAVPSFAGRPVTGWIANRERVAEDLLHQKQPALAFVPPGFYYKHLAGAHHQGTPVAQIPRFGVDHERYYLIVPKEGASSLTELEGKVVRTTFEVDEAYLERVVFPETFQPGQHFTLEPSENLADELFLLLEGAAPGETPAAALLLDEELKQFFEQDDLVWPDVRVVWISKGWPRDLVVALGADWDEAARTSLQAALFRMKESPGGRELLDLMNSSGFSEVDAVLLEQTRKVYQATQ